MLARSSGPRFRASNGTMHQATRLVRAKIPVAGAVSSAPAERSGVAGASRSNEAMANSPGNRGDARMTGSRYASWAIPWQVIVALTNSDLEPDDGPGSSRAISAGTG